MTRSWLLQHNAPQDWVIWGLLRALLVAIIMSWVPWPEQVHDLVIYAAWAQGSLASGQFPADEMWQYPPLAGPVMLVGHLLPGDRAGFVALFLGFDAVILWMLARQARQSSRSLGRTLRAAAPLITGPLLLARFDVVPTAFALAAVLIASRPVLSGAAAAVGAWLKVWPALVIAGLPRRDLPRGILGAAITSLIIAAVLLIGTQNPWSFLTGQRDRGLQFESVPAAGFLVARLIGAPVSIVYRYGAHEVLGPGVEAAATLSVLVSVALLGLVAVRRLAGGLEHLIPADVALAAVLFSVATSRVFSGQYFIWLLALAAACLNDPGTQMRRPVIALVGAGLASHLIYPWLYSALLAGEPVAVAIQCLRIGLTVAAAALALSKLRGPASTPLAKGPL